MEAKIKDDNKLINAALRTAGFDVNQIATEIILNVIDYTREKQHETKMFDILEIKELVKSLFEIRDEKINK